MIINRRSMLGSLGMGAALLMAGCAGQTPQQITQTTIADVQLFASGLSRALPLISSLPGVSVSGVAQVSSVLAQIDAIAPQVSQTITTAGAQPLIQQLMVYFNELLTLLPLLGVALPPQVTAIIAAAKVLLPFIMLAVGLPAPASAGPGSMSVDQARAVLAGG